jgi:hypothetical protein
MHKSATKCNETIGKWCKNKHGASKIIDMFETYQRATTIDRGGILRNPTSAVSSGSEKGQIRLNFENGFILR